MIRHALAAGTTAAVIGAALTMYSPVVPLQGQTPIAVRCLHDSDETPQHRVRREGALALARAINSAQGRVAEATRRYAPLEALGTLPATPEDFVVRLYTDGEGYVVSIKDDRDPCQFGIFSDQKGFLYHGAPSLPLVAS